jgi:undecaprenyl-diphosphatase
VNFARAKDEFPGRVNDIDDRVDDWWERLRGITPVDRMYYTASELGNFAVIWHMAGIVQAIIEDDPKLAVGISAAVGIESALVNGPVKSMFKRSRPVQDVPRPYKLRQPRTSSFPSGHASAAMVAAALLSRHTGGAAWYAVAAVVATSRIHVRIHHASDVAGGAVLGVALGVIARRVLA